MKEKLTLKDCTKENFEKSLKVLEDAERAYKEKEFNPLCWTEMFNQGIYG